MIFDLRRDQKYTEHKLRTAPEPARKGAAGQDGY
jgi:hypothetical protein